MITRKLLKFGTYSRYKMIYSKSWLPFHSKLLYSSDVNPDIKLIQRKVKQTKNLENFSGFKLALETEKQEFEKNLFPSLKQMNVVTENRLHNFSASCDNIIRFIKMGTINKNISLQYCHYLCHLCRTCQQEDYKYYYKRALDLMVYLLKNGKELANITKIQLISDVADTSEENCNIVCNEILDKYNLRDKLSISDISKLMTACYRLNSWKTATSIVNAHDELRIVNPRLFDPLIKSLINLTDLNSIDKNDINDIESKKLTEQQKDDIMEHLFRIIEIGFRDRIQFVTKYQKELIKGLQYLGVKVVHNPTLKLSGRCTNCDTIIPVYNNQDTSKLNESIREVLQTRTIEDYHLNTSREDLNKFEKFLEKLYNIDKKPIDCVIDGPNICYKNTIGYFYYEKEISQNLKVSHRRHNPGHQVQVLVNTMLRNNMLQMFKKILVIGKEHMQNWPGLVEFFDRHRIHYYFSENHTKDDLFQLYASTLNPKTIVVTNDFLRDHIALLEGEKRVLLERWIDTHQAWIFNKNLKAIWPTPYEKIPSVDRDTGYFHIPIIDYNKLDILGQHEPPPHLNTKLLNWICCRKVRSNGIE